MKKSLIKHPLTITVVVLIVVTVLAWAIFYSHSNKLMQAQNDIEQTRQALTKQGINTESDYGCGQDRVKFGGGTKRCSASIKTTISGTQADIVATENKINNILTTSSFTLISNKDQQQLKTIQTHNYTHNKTGLPCYSRLEIKGNDTNNNNVNASYTFYCTQKQ